MKKSPQIVAAFSGLGKSYVTVHASGKVVDCDRAYGPQDHYPNDYLDWVEKTCGRHPDKTILISVDVPIVKELQARGHVFRVVLPHSLSDMLSRLQDRGYDAATLKELRGTYKTLYAHPALDITYVHPWKHLIDYL